MPAREASSPAGNRARAVALGLRGLVTLAGAALMGWAAGADAHWAERHVLPSSCVTSGPEWLVARGLPWGAAALGAATIWKLAPALASRAPRIAVRRHARALAGIALAVAAALGVGELVARWRFERVMPGDRATGPDGSRALARPDPRLGWAHLPGRTTVARVGDRVVAYAIDAEGDRAASCAGRPDPARPTILFAGESIMFGWGLAHEETIPSVVGRDLGVQTVNLAVTGYGNDQAYLRALDALPGFRRPLALVSLFIPAQLGRNVEPWRPRLGLGPNGALVPLPASRAPRVARLLQALPFRGGEALRVTAAILRATADAARARGAIPLFLVTNYGPPCRRDDGGEAWIVDELFVRQGLPFVRVDLDRDDVLPGLLERHPSARGARKLASAVETALSAPLGLRGVEAVGRDPE